MKYILNLNLFFDRGLHNNKCNVDKILVVIKSACCPKRMEWIIYSMWHLLELLISSMPGKFPVTTFKRPYQ